jgi:hypothetical protein
MSQLPTPDDGIFIPHSAIHSAWFNATTNYFAVLASLYSYLAGNITVTEGLNAASFAYAPPTIAVANTLLVNAAASSFTDGNLAWSTHSELPSKMEGLLQNITLSILTGSLDATQTTSTTCIRMESIQLFEYDAHRLWLVYGLGLGAALLCDLVGIAALFRNAFGATDDFSDFLGATRNAELDTLDLKQPGRIRLRYGPVRSEGGRCAFARPENLYEDGGVRRRTMRRFCRRSFMVMPVNVR